MDADHEGLAEDHRMIDGLVRTFLAAFTSGPGVAEQLAALRAIFIPEATIIFAGGLQPRVWDLAAFVAPRQQLLTDGTLRDFHEWEESGHTQVFGGIAQHWSTYAKSGVQDGAAFTGRGQKTMQFVRTAEGWRISSVAWDDEP
jgi:hypothetical protein